jgi:sporulation protein YlmC with PRC-barrel domain
MIRDTTKKEQSHMLEKTNLMQLDEFRGKSIISTSDGQRIGKVEDILIDPGNLKIEGIVTSRGGFMRPDVRAIKATDVEVWGQDVVLVTHPDVIVRREDISGLENCLSVTEHIVGRDVITLDGQRIGELFDLLVDNKGNLTGYDVSKVRSELADLFGGNKRRDYTLPVDSIHSFGKDVLIVDLSTVKGSIPEELLGKPEKDLNADYKETVAADRSNETLDTEENSPPRNDS